MWLPKKLLIRNNCIDSRIASRKVLPSLLQLVGAHLEYCVQLCVPHFGRDTERLQKSRRGVTRVVREPETIPHKEQLREPKVFSPDSEGT